MYYTHQHKVVGVVHVEFQAIAHGLVLRGELLSVSWSISVESWRTYSLIYVATVRNEGSG